MVSQTDMDGTSDLEFPKVLDQANAQTSIRILTIFLFCKQLDSRTKRAIRQFREYACSPPVLRGARMPGRLRPVIVKFGGLLRRLIHQ